jgi:DNA polymerase I-like protein with 3'-5' exonuclease and polymerase domains
VVATKRPKELIEILRDRSQVHCNKIGYSADSSSVDTIRYRTGQQILANLELEKLKLVYNNSLKNMLNYVRI